jgi:HPt (histidine-containing phosphotransfer) domain-containing protein
MATEFGGISSAKQFRDDVSTRALARHFLDTKDQLLDNIHEALHDGDAERFKRSAHELNDTVGIFGGERLAALCHHLERMGEDETFTGAEETLMEISGAIHGIGKSIETELKGS